MVVGLVVLPERGCEQQFACAAGGFACDVDRTAGALLDQVVGREGFGGLDRTPFESDRAVCVVDVVCVESVADIDPKLVGGWEVLEGSLGEGFDCAGAAGVGASSGERFRVEVDGARERGPVPGREPRPDHEVGVGDIVVDLRDEVGRREVWSERLDQEGQRGDVAGKRLVGCVNVELGVLITEPVDQEGQLAEESC